MPKAIIYSSLVMVILAMIPPALIARMRAVNTEARRIHFIQDMDNQGKFRAQSLNPLFADHRGMRPPVPGTIARGELNEDDHVHRGIVYDARGEVQWATTFPKQIPLTTDLMKRGQVRFDIYCRVCHGDAGYGDGIVNKRAMELLNNPLISNGTQWVQPKSVHEEAIRAQPPGQIFNTITKGIRTMAGYESQIPTADRWAIVAYVKALQRSQHAFPEDVPIEQRSNIPTVNLPQDVVDAFHESKRKADEGETN